MRSAYWRVFAALASVLVLNHMALAQDRPATDPAVSAPPATAACGSVQEFASTDCPLTWHGITLFGVHDVGVGWVSHGLPENDYHLYAGRGA